jgi:hypothetical protein
MALNALSVVLQQLLRATAVEATLLVDAGMTVPSRVRLGMILHHSQISQVNKKKQPFSNVTGFREDFGNLEQERKKRVLICS